MTSGGRSASASGAQVGAGVFAGYGRPEAPFGGYALLVGLLNSLFPGLLVLASRLGRPLPDRVSPTDLVVLGFATHKLSRLISKDIVTSVVRAPFAEFVESAGPSEVNEKPRGHGLHLAAGELITCPFCIGQWVAASVGCGLVLPPRGTRLIGAVFAMVGISDFLHYGYEATQKVAEQPESSDEDES